MSTRSARGRHERVLRRVVAIAPHSADGEANCAVVRQPLDVLHSDRAPLGCQSLHVPEQQVEVDCRRLQVLRVQTPIDVRQRLRAANFIDALIRESVTRHSEHVN